MRGHLVDIVVKRDACEMLAEEDEGSLVRVGQSLDPPRENQQRIVGIVHCDHRALVNRTREDVRKQTDRNPEKRRVVPSVGKGIRDAAASEDKV